MNFISHSRRFIRVFWICTFLVSMLGLHAQETLSFTNPTIINGGTALQVGTQYRFQNVGTVNGGVAIDALVTITATNAASLNVFDNDFSYLGTGVSDFNPVVQINDAQIINGSIEGGYVDFLFEFVLNSNNSIEVPIELDVYAYDVDGDSQFLREYIVVTGLNSYTINGTTDVVYSPIGRFESNTAQFNNGLNGNDQFLGRAEYLSVSSFSLRAGVLRDAGDQDFERLAGIAFQPVTFSDPETILLDTDGDGIADNIEFPNGTDFNNPCDPIQGPGYSGFDSNNAIWQQADCDNDGVNNITEFNDGDDTTDSYCEDRLTSGGGQYVSSIFFTDGPDADGLPDGDFTENISGNTDELVLSYPNLNIGDQICVTLGFNNTNGVFVWNLNDAGPQEIINPNGTVGFLSQEICLTVTQTGLQELKIGENGSGALRVDGSTYFSCGTPDIDTDGDGIIDTSDICNGFDDTIDTDGDNIPDGCDEDDDNDGILDVDECPYNILWVTQGSPTLAQQNTINKIIALGHNVTVIDDNDSSNANNFDAVFVFEDALSGNVLDNVQNLTSTGNGVVTSETALHDDFFGSEPGSESIATSVEIINNAHFISEGLPIGGYAIGSGNNKASPNLTSGTVLGNHPDGEAALVFWDKGDDLDIGIAPGRRVIIPHGNSLGVEFNAQGEDILVNAILWAAAESDFTLCDIDNDNLKDSIDNDSDNDGCFDALEGDGRFSDSDINGQGRLLGGVDPLTGIPIIAGTGQNDISSKDGGVIATICEADSDNDGVPDNLDQCSDTPNGEPVDAAGCSDSQLDDDNDGVNNNVDLCPDTPQGEAVDANGCSDSQLDDDNDGVNNNLDQCPDTPQGEAVDANGCSDSQLDDDNDSVNNNLDQCPDTPQGETVDANGCSDSQLDEDNDGVNNNLDQCPDTPQGETVDANGCSDSQLDDDNDGVNNIVDLCPDTPQGETVNTNGCSDSQLDDDNDGVNNNLDQCPDTPQNENVDANGCANSQTPDSDGDGITDGEEIDNGTDLNNPCDPLQLPGYNGFNPANSIWASADCDGDGVNNIGEFTNGTDPYSISDDTDGDGIDDDNEIENGTDLNDTCDPIQNPGYTGFDENNITWRAEDCDGDGVINGDEFDNGTDPYSASDDSDGDGIVDDIENANGSNPNDPCDPAQSPGYTSFNSGNSVWGNADCDGDGIDNIDEFANGTDPYLASGDSDGDGINDDLERENGTDANDACDPVQDSGYEGFNDQNTVWVSSDCDGDSVTNGDEVINGTDPYLASEDTDGDGLIDDVEINNSTDSNNPCDPIQQSGYSGFNDANSIWSMADCDGDGITNGEEIINGTDPYTSDNTGNSIDSDGDGIVDNQETIDGTDPNDSCDSFGGTPSATDDCDGDGLTNAEETFGLDDPNTEANPNGRITDPDNFDTDDDTISDGQESLDGTNPNDGCDSNGGTPPTNVDCGALSIASDLVTPNTNNGIFSINNIERFPNNTVSIFNRWGVKVYEAQGYDNRNIAFNGISNARATLQQSEELPVGVYFYIIEYDNNGTEQTINGYLYLNR